MRTSLLLLALLSAAATRVCDITDFGAVGDGATDSTFALREAARCCAASPPAASTGGPRVGPRVACTVRVPAGVFASGAFNLSGGSRLHLAANATLRALGFDWKTWRYHWPEVTAAPGYGETRDQCCVPWPPAVTRRRSQHAPFVGAFDATDVAISGEGSTSVIDGRGADWWRRFLCGFAYAAAQRVGAHPWALAALSKANGDVSRGWRCSSDASPERRYANLGYALGRPRLVEFSNVRRGAVRGVLLVDSPFWTLHIVDSKEIILQDLTIRAPRHETLRRAWGANTDGIDIDSSEDVLVDRVDIRVGDDAIAIKSGLGAAGRAHAAPSRRVAVRDSRLRSEWLSIGSEVSGGVDDVRVENCTFGDAAVGGAAADDVSGAGFWLRLLTGGWAATPAARARGGPAGVHVKTRPGRGGFVTNVVVDGATALNSDALLWISTTYPGEDPFERAADAAETVLANFSVKRATCANCERVVDVVGSAAIPVDGLAVEDVDSDATESACARATRVSGVACEEPAPSRLGVVAAAVAVVALALAVLVARRARVPAVLLHASFASTFVVSSFWLRSNAYRGASAGLFAAPCAFAPAPVSAPWLNAVDCGPVFPGLALAVSAAYASPSKRRRALAAALALKVAAVVARARFDSRARAAAATLGLCRAALAGQRDDAVALACAAHAAQGEPARTAWGAATSALVAGLAVAELLRSS